MNPFLTNPFGIFHKGLPDPVTWGRPTAVLMAGRSNRYDPAFQVCRDGGAEVLAYLNPVERPDNAGASELDRAVYMGDPSGVPLWGNGRVNYSGHTMTDIRVGSQWSNFFVDYVQGLIVERRVDGVFLDVLGARLWSKLAAWDQWAAHEQIAWTAGAVDLVRRIDGLRRNLNENFILVNNNTWEGIAEAEKCVDGICIEHHPWAADSAIIRKAGREYSDLGNRRVLVITRNVGASTALQQAQLWKDVPGVTHVSDQLSSEYAADTTPAVGFNDIKPTEPVYVGPGQFVYGRARAVQLVKDLQKRHADAVLKLQRTELALEESLAIIRRP